jgi:hypothetical protein
VIVKSGLRTWTMLAGVVLSLVLVAGCNSEETPPAPAGGAPAAAPAPPPTKAPEAKTPMPPAGKPEEKK